MINEFAKEIWQDNYKGPSDKTLEDTWRRLAKAAASIEPKSKRDKIEESYYEILSNGYFMPGGRIVAILGVEGREATTLMNCFVHHPMDIGIRDPDSIHGIAYMLEAQMHTLKSEGGYGTNFSYIRPDGAYVDGIGGRTPGVLKFMELWDKSSEIITKGSDKQQGGARDGEKQKIRKGAQMAVLSVWHPDVEEFIVAKQTEGRLTKFNMSVGITEGFIDAVLENKDWDLIFPDTTFEKYNDEWNGDIDVWKEKKYPIIVYKTIKAKELWDQITYATYTRNEPGVLFLDLFNKLNPLAYVEKIFQTNPCGEIGMATGVCNLGSLILLAFIKIVNKQVTFDFDKYKEVIALAIRFLDAINTISRAPLLEYKVSMEEKRRIGLGNMGIGSLLFMMATRYNSSASKDLIKKIYKTKAETEILASAELGKEKGSFALFDKDKYFSTYWWKNLKIDKEVKKKVEEIGCMRNSHRSMNAPTGNTAIFASFKYAQGIISNGIEPVFLKSYNRWVILSDYERRKLRKDGLEFPNALSGEWFETKHFKFTKQGDEVVLKGHFNEVNYQIDKNRGITKEVEVMDAGWEFAQYFYNEEQLQKLELEGAFDTTAELNVKDHIDILEIIAHYTDMNNSKTVNISADYPFDDFKDLYLNAWHANIKGLTTYRAGTMTAVLEAKEQMKEYQNDLEQQFEEAGTNIIHHVQKLPDEYYSKGYILRDNGKKKWYITLAFVDKNHERPYAMFVNTNVHEGKEVTDNFIKSMEKLLIDKGIDSNLVNEQITKYSSQRNTTKIARIIGMALRHNLNIIDIVEVLDEYDVELSSFIFHIKKLLSKFIKDGTSVKKEKCSNPSCKRATIVYQDGCKMCTTCGWSAC